MRDPDNKDELQFGYWLVAFFDLLGIKERYLATDHLPSNEDEMRALLNNLKSGVGAVQGLRQLLDRFEEGMNGTIRSATLEASSARGHDVQKALRLTRTIRTNVSDAIMLACSLASDDENFPIRGIYDTIIKSASMLVVSLAAGKPIRGGLDVGTALLDGHELFGAAPVKAYLLESKYAQYPRLIVGDSLIQRLLQGQSTPGEGVRAQVERQVAERLLSFLRQDEFDQRWIVDYAGAAFRNAMAEVPNMNDLLRKALTFAVRSRDEFAQRHDENGRKLRARYEALVRYLESSGPF